MAQLAWCQYACLVKALLILNTVAERGAPPSLPLSRRHRAHLLRLLWQPERQCAYVQVWGQTGNLCSANEVDWLDFQSTITVPLVAAVPVLDPP
jgi:hypothetical protein